MFANRLPRLVATTTTRGWSARRLGCSLHAAAGPGVSPATSTLTHLAVCATAAASLLAYSSYTTTTTITTTTTRTTHCAASRVTSAGDVITAGTPVKEAATGIFFPPLCNGYYLVGTGVRVKYGFVKVYAVGTYLDPLAMAAVVRDPAAMERALLDPTYPRTLRLVMNRNLSVDKFTAAIVDALLPRMRGQDLDALEEFKKLNPPVDLVQGAEIEMTIRGDTVLYRNAVGGVGSIRSAVFSRALCDVYYGADPVSPSHKAACLAGLAELK